MIKLSKEATKTVEINSNADKTTQERERGERNTGRREDNGEGGEWRRPGEDKQFKEPTGGSPEMISQEYSPLIANEWGEDMRLYAKRCSNLDSLAFGEKRTLCKIFVEQSLWSEVQFG